MQVIYCVSSFTLGTNLEHRWKLWDISLLLKKTDPSKSNDTSLHSFKKENSSKPNDTRLHLLHSPHRMLITEFGRRKFRMGICWSWITGKSKEAPAPTAQAPASTSQAPAPEPIPDPDPATSPVGHLLNGNVDHHNIIHSLLFIT